MGELLCIAGLSSVGKSTTARSLAKQYDVPTFSLGDYQRKMFAPYGTPEQYHKKFGLDVTYYGLWPDYLKCIEATKSEKGIIIEGIYTKEFLTLLQQKFPKDKVHVMRISAPNEVRIGLFQKKTGLHDAAEAAIRLDELDRIKYKVGLAEVLRGADVTIQNNSSLASLLKDAAKYVEGFFTV